MRLVGINVGKTPWEEMRAVIIFDMGSKRAGAIVISPDLTVPRAFQYLRFE